jgi:hypothetical protein
LSQDERACIELFELPAEEGAVEPCRELLRRFFPSRDFVDLRHGNSFSLVDGQVFLRWIRTFGVGHWVYEKQPPRNVFDCTKMPFAQYIEAMHFPELVSISPANMEGLILMSQGKEGSILWERVQEIYKQWIRDYWETSAYWTGAASRPTVAPVAKLQQLQHWGGLLRRLGLDVQQTWSAWEEMGGAFNSTRPHAKNARSADVTALMVKLAEGLPLTIHSLNCRALDLLEQTPAGDTCILRPLEELELADHCSPRALAKLTGLEWVYPVASRVLLGLLTHTPFLKSLSLCTNSEWRQSGHALDQLKDALGAVKLLDELCLAVDAPVDADVAHCLIRAMHSWPLRRLRLEFRGEHADYRAALSKAALQLPFVETLDLENVDLGSDPELLQGVELPQLTSLSLRNIATDIASRSACWSLIEKAPRLECLSLHGIPLEDGELLELLNLLPQMKQLELLRLDDCGVSKELFSEVDPAWPSIQVTCSGPGHAEEEHAVFLEELSHD